MDSIESIFFKRQMIEDLRMQSLRLPISNEAEHANIFNRIWRLKNEIKALETAVNNGVAYNFSPSQNQTQNQDDMGDDFTSIPVEPTPNYLYAPESMYPNLMRTYNMSQNQNQTQYQSQLNDRQKKLNGILFELEILEKQTKTQENDKNIQILQNTLMELC